MTRRLIIESLESVGGHLERAISFTNGMTATPNSMLMASKARRWLGA
jgi:hypothetical protein